MTACCSNASAPAARCAPRADRARQGHNLLGDFAAGLADADAALPPTEPTATAATTTTTTPSRRGAQRGRPWHTAHEARGVALAGLGRMQDAQAAFQAQLAASGAGSAQLLAGVTHFMLGDWASESALRETLNNASGEGPQLHPDLALPGQRASATRPWQAGPARRGRARRCQPMERRPDCATWPA